MRIESASEQLQPLTAVLPRHATKVGTEQEWDIELTVEDGPIPDVREALRKPAEL